MILTFEHKILLQLVEAVENGFDHKVPYTGEGFSRPLETTPGLLLVGDEGVYLLGNNEPGPNEPVHVAYANEANPKRMGFYEYRQVKEASFGADDGCMFLDLETVKSQMLVKAIPLIDLTPGTYALGCVDSLDELYEEPFEAVTPVIKIGEIEEIVDADYVYVYTYDEDDNQCVEEYYDDEEKEPLITWRNYLAYTQVPFDFAVREMKVDPDEYDYRNYCRRVSILLNPEDLWAKVELEEYGELNTEQMDYSQVFYKDMALAEIAVEEMFTWHADTKEDLSENSYRITCEFNPDRLPDHLSWEGVQNLFKDALAEISPKSTLSFKKGKYYCFRDHGHSDGAFLQFLVYKWLMDNRPQLEPQHWLTIHCGDSNNFFDELLSAYFGWPTCEICGFM